MERRNLFGCLVAISALVVSAAILTRSAQASLPVPYAVVGCIKDGRFHSEGAIGPQLVNSAFKSLEGKTIQVEGFLSPGDRFAARELFIVDEQCRDDLHSARFLCDPCQTLPHQPAGRLQPRSPNLKPVALPGGIISEFDNLPSGLRK